MWNPFRKQRVIHSTQENNKTSESYDSGVELNPAIKNEIDKAQLRSLKARTEISMLYSRLAEDALSSMKGQNNAI